MAVFNLPILILSDRTPTAITGTTVGTTIAIDENIATGSLVATMTHDGTAASFAIASGNTNGDFAIANNGDITVANSPDYETTSSYALGITATDALGNTSAPFTVTININDLDEIPPVVTLVSQTYNAVFENDNNLTIASFTATDAGNDVTSSLTLSGTPNATNFALSYNSSTQQMDLVTASSGLLGGGVTADQTFTLTASATDASGNTGSQSITLVVKNAEVPTITSGSASFSIIENTSTSTVLQTYGASGTAPISWSVSGTDASDFNINTNGELTFATSPDYESQTTHYVTVVATNQFGSDTLAVTVSITNDTADDNILTLSSTAGTQTFDFTSAGTTVTKTGYVQARDNGTNTPQLYELTVASAMSCRVTLEGAGGGGASGSNGGAGGKIVGDITFQPNVTYEIVVGGGGSPGDSSSVEPYGGYGGGGSGGHTSRGSNGNAFGLGGNVVGGNAGIQNNGGGGGGLTGVFATSVTASNAIMIAGGGGGGSSSGKNGGSGGGRFAGGSGVSDTYATGGGGGQTTYGGPGGPGRSNGRAGSQGSGGGGGSDYYDGTYEGGGGGGGGYYGGGGGGADELNSSDAGGGGGGSGYIKTSGATGYMATLVTQVQGAGRASELGGRFTIAKN